jgi:chaperone BCS1
MKVELHLADEDMINQLFFFVYDLRPDQGEHGGDGTEDLKGVNDCELSVLTQEFVAKIPKLVFSPAEIMSLLLANKQSPRHAIAGVDAWMETIKEERRKFPRIHSWALDEDDADSDH